MATPDGYDAVPYPSEALEQTHPDRLAVQGRLFGITTASPSRCRYLELGCGSGMNLLAMASSLPDAHFTGIDLAAEPICQAVRDAQDLGLANVVFQQGDILALGDDSALGEFDYIVAHGVFSWVPPEVRTALLRVCRLHLAAQGVAYISYNAFPGGHIRQMVRGMMRYHVRDITAVEERLDQGRALIRFLAEAKTGPGIYAPLLQRELAHLTDAADGLIHHDDFAPINQPYYLHEFLAAAASHHLQFVSEAMLQEMQTHSFPAEVRKTLSQMDGDVAMREQYLDFLTCRRFRQTLLCHDALTLEHRATPLQAVRTLLIASNAQRTPTDPAQTPSAPGKGSYLRVGRAGLTTTSPVMQVVLDELGARFPRALTFAAVQELLTTHPELGPVDADTLSGVIWHLAEIGMADLRCEPIPGAADLSERPRASRLVRFQIQRSNQVTSHTHTTVRLEGALLPAVIRALDGTRSQQDLCEQISALVRRREITAADGLDPDDPAAVSAASARAVPVALERLRALALLEA